jgi:DNA polymerase-3 subunit delta
MTPATGTTRPNQAARPNHAAQRGGLGAVTLVTGPEELLNERAVAAVRAAVQAADPDAEVSDTTGDQVSMATLGELAAPSLFSSTRCVVVRAVEDLPDTTYDGLLDYAAAPADDIALVLVHGGGQKGSGLLTRLRKLPTVTERKSVAPKPGQLPGFVTAEVRSHGGRMTAEAAAHLVQAVGTDLRALAGAAHQLATDFPGEQLTAELVGRYFAGRAEVKAFVIADHALFGRTAEALEELRWALEAGTSPVFVTGSFATAVRGLARFRGAPRGLRDDDLAREAGVPPWKLRLLREQARGWDDRGLAAAVTAVARADADVKGAAADAAFALERMVLTIGEARAAR